jgi:hypothetical protein
VDAGIVSFGRLSLAITAAIATTNGAVSGERPSHHLRRFARKHQLAPLVGDASTFKLASLWLEV